MDMDSGKQIKNKFAVFFLLVILGFIVFIAMLLVWSNMDRDLPNFRASETKTALRGTILSEDNYTLAATKRLYEVSIDTRNLDPDKKNLFIKLYSIYSGDSEQSVKSAIEKRNGSVTLSYKIDSKQAEHLRSLAKTLLRLGVFKSYQNPQNGKVIFNGMDVKESGEMRIYPYKDALEPLIGYTNKFNTGRIIKRGGIKGIEHYYDDRLSSIQDSYLVGSRDISNTVILNRNIQAKERIDGQNIQISIPLKFQKIVENMLDSYKRKFEAKEIIAVVMKSDTGDILSLATSSRYDRNNVKDIGLMNINAVEYTYQPGSVMKPIIYAILLRENKVKPNDIVNIYDGKYKLGPFWIRDEHKFDSNWISAENAIIYSSNVGIAQLAQKLDTLSYYKGLTDFGITQKSQIDLSYEKTGYIGSLNGEVYKGTVGYGYGLHVNFMQLIKAFNVFNNDGFMVNPKIAAFIIDKLGKKHEIGYDQKIYVLPENIAKTVQSTLIKAVTTGTGLNAQVEGITIGGKTGTAEIRKNNKITGYDSSFIGFANDETGAKYTIGVLVIEPSRNYFGAQSAAPIFKNIALSMIEEGYLKKSP
ncbi:MAG: penicillin-binding protein 2 [Campylobacteraceae bacterium]|jgi:cell division protein FtsI (penicillin-binding protein 3)|nr:penicillin-binding protein 2 [Campylobacteraceae bacterium]